jgi:hypothetical protein
MLCFRLPGPDNPSGILEKNSPPTVAGAVADLTKPYRIPMSLALRPTNLNSAHHPVNFRGVNIATCPFHEVGRPKWRGASNARGVSHSRHSGFVLSFFATTSFPDSGPIPATPLAK